jgi:hypothetical protein
METGERRTFTLNRRCRAAASFDRFDRSGQADGKTVDCDSFHAED